MSNLEHLPHPTPDPDKLHRAALTCARRYPNPHDPDLRDVLEMLGWLSYESGQRPAGSRP